MTYVFAHGSGTADDPYLVGTAADLNGVRDYLDAYFIQTADIILESSWTPWANFKGVYNGNGFTIANLDKSLMDIATESTIQKVGLIDVNITSGSTVGALANNAWGATIEECYSTGTIKVSASRLGGLIGILQNWLSKQASVKNCYSSCSVENTNASESYTGGMIGIAGYTLPINTLENCFSVGAVSAAYTTGVGGFAGYKGSTSTITNCFYDSTTSGQTDTGKGDPKTTAEMQTQSTFAGWDFDTVWAMDSSINDGYPCLQWQIPPLIEVWTAEDLNNVRNNLSGRYIQMADIDLSGYENWEPIGNPVTESKLDCFSGIYDGNEFQISNLTIQEQLKPASGLFGAVWGGTIKNVTLSDCYMKNTFYDPEGASLIGGVAAITADGTKIQNCSVLGNLMGAAIMGGVVGFSVGEEVYCQITNCLSKCSITNGEIEHYGSVAGGIIGIASKKATIESSCAMCDISISAECYAIAGVLVGEIEYYSNVKNSYAIGSASCESDSATYAGGLIGCITWGTYGALVENCYSVSTTLEAIGNDPEECATGGLIGERYGGTITSSFYDQETSGQSDTGKGEPKTTAEMKTQSTYTDWDFADVWGIDPAKNDGYPYLLWQKLEPEEPPEVLPSYSPQSTIKLEFKAGDSDPYPMGIFYADKSVYKVGNAGTKIDGRNSIGKYLKDQSFDERCKYPSQAVSTMLESMLSGAGLTKYYVQPNLTQMGMDYAPNKNILDGIEEVLQYLPAWQMREEVDGTVVIGDRTDSHFTQPSRYTFQRDRDIFSREVVTDDRAIYGRVCVHTEDFTVRVYRPVTSELGWTPPAQKTLYQQVPEGTTSMEAAVIANNLAASMANSGKVETFVCAFRPQIIPGDEAEILEADKSKTMLGVITQVKHSFGVQGFYTEIVVDSGGRVGKPRFKDIVSAFTPPPATKKN